MATSALVCINLKTRRKGGSGANGEVTLSSASGDGSGSSVGGEVNVSASTQQLVQALVDNGIIQLSNKATIRVIDSGAANNNNNGSKDHHERGGGILVETLSAGSANGGEEGTSKLLIQNRPILVQRNLYLSSSGSGSSAGATGAKVVPPTSLLHLLHHSSSGAGSGSNSGAGGSSAGGTEEKLQLVQLSTAPGHHHHQDREQHTSTGIVNSAVIGNQTTTSDGEPIKLPDNLESLPRADHFPVQRHRWNTNEEIAAILITFERHLDWQSKEVKIRPKSGSMLLYSRKKVRYRRDGYCWKKRKDGKTTREDHMKLKVQGTECIYGCYVHSAILPTFHRRCYWLLQNPDIVLVHYLNVPYPDDNKLVSPTLSLCADKKQWTKEELISQLKPMFYSEDEPEFNNELEISTAETVETIVSQLLERQRSARASAICKQLECGCPDSTCTDAKTCTHPIRRIQASKSDSDTNQVSSTTGTTIRSQTERQLHMHTIHQGQVIQSGSGSGGRSGPLVLNLSQIQTGGLLILNPTSSSQSHHHTQQQSSIVSVASSGSGVVGHHHHPTSVATTTAAVVATSLQPHQQLVHHTTRHHHHLVTTTGSGANGSGAASAAAALAIRQSLATTKVTTRQDLPFQVVSDDIKEMVKVNYSNGSGTGGNSSNQHSGDSKANQQHQQQFYHTLDLTQEDIHQTLSANLPLNATRISTGSGGNNGSGSNVNGSESVTVAGGLKHSSNSMLSGLEEIDFIDVNSIHQDDDVLVNLDAFDMLTEFPELDPLDAGAGVNPSQLTANNGSITGDILGRHHASQRHSSSNGVDESSDMMEESDNKDDVTFTAANAMNSASSATNNNSSSVGGTTSSPSSATITDFSPDWAYTDGGVKVLVTGPWYSSCSNYSVLFDSVPVPTTLVQSGVLRCFCPAHEAGFVTLQVACNGVVVSNSEMFEYKKDWNGGCQNVLLSNESTITKPSTNNSGTTTNWDGLLRLSLVQRLDWLSQSVDDSDDATNHRVKLEPPSYDSLSICNYSIGSGGGMTGSSGRLEESLVACIDELSCKRWRKTHNNNPLNMEHSGNNVTTITTLSSTPHNMTLLHLAASLGYTRLILALIQWRAQNPHCLLESEVDATSQDAEGKTPLMRACMNGKVDSARLLAEWEPGTVDTRDLAGRTCLDLAVENGHSSISSPSDILLTSNDVNDKLSKECSLMIHESDSQDDVFIHPSDLHRTGSAMELHVNIPSGLVDVGSKSSKGSSPRRPLDDEMSSSSSLSSSIKATNGNRYCNKRQSVDSGLQSSVGSSISSLDRQSPHQAPHVYKSSPSSTISSSSSVTTMGQMGRPSPPSVTLSTVSTLISNTTLSNSRQMRFERSMSLPIGNSPNSVCFDASTNIPPDQRHPSPRCHLGGDFTMCAVYFSWNCKWSYQ